MENINDEMHNNTSTKTIVSFFSGYGGLEIGISAALGGNTRVLASVEREAFAVANLVSKMEKGLMEPSPVFTDVTQFPYREFRGLVDIACGGVPCQPHSHAGKRQGGADERFLFDDFIAGMSEMRPGIIFIENVEGLLSSKMPYGSLCIRYVLNQLENIGYCVEDSKGQPLIGIFSASEVGAPHQRKRVFILAYDRDRRCENGISRQDNGEKGNTEESGNHSAWPSRPGERQYGWEPPRTVVGQPKERGERGERQRGVRAGEEANSEREADNHDADGPSKDDVTGELQELGYSVEPCEQCQKDGDDRYIVCFADNGSGDCCSVEGMRKILTDAREDGDLGEPALQLLDGGRNAWTAGMEELTDAGGEVIAELGLHADGSSGKMGTPLTCIPLMGYDKSRGDYATQKTCAYKILRELRDFAGTEGLQWTAGGLWSFLAETILQSGLQRDVFPQKVCYFIWASLTGNEVEGKELPEMWFNKADWDSPRRQEPSEQFKRELDYAMCVLSYEIALERGKEALEAKGEMRGVREWCEAAWILSETLAEDSEVWKSTFNEESWANRAYFEAAGLGANRTDELRMLGTGVVPACAEKAFRVLYAELMGAQTEQTNSECAEMGLCPKPPKQLF